MALLSVVWYTLLALLGLSIPPDAPPTEGIRGISCRGLEVKDGSASCFKDGPKTVCEVFCDGKRQGGFSCAADKGWTPELPPCAKPIEGSDNGIEQVLKAESGGCPNTHICTEFCHSQGRERGRCIGIYKSICSCN